WPWPASASARRRTWVVVPAPSRPSRTTSFMGASHHTRDAAWEIYGAKVASVKETGIVVQKYGGSSVADVDKIRLVHKRIARTKSSGKKVVVVVSAMGKTTNQLIDKAKAVSPSPSRRELDMLLTCGEREAMALVAMACAEEGLESISFTGSQAGIMT